MPAFLSVFLGWPKLSACWPVELDCSGHRPFAGELGHGRSRNWTRDWAQYWPVDILNELLTARAGQEIQTRETYIHIRFFRSSLSISSFLGIAYSADLPVQNKNKKQKQKAMLFLSWLLIWLRFGVLCWLLSLSCVFRYILWTMFTALQTPLWWWWWWLYINGVNIPRLNTHNKTKPLGDGSRLNRRFRLVPGKVANCKCFRERG